MKRLTILSIVIAAGLASVAWTVTAVESAWADSKSGSGAKPTASRAYLHGYNLPSSGLALEGYCPVAYFALNKPVIGKPEHASTYNGVTYYFVSSDAKRLFDATPEKYLPAYGGWCALGMVEQDKFPVDPRNFKIVHGKLLLFLKNKNVDALELWNGGNEQDNLKKANAHWRKVSS